MREFLIRTSSDHGWPAFHRSRLADVLRPEGWDSESVGGDGDFRVHFAGVDIAYFGDEVGWQVVVEGELPQAEGWMSQVTTQVEAAAGEPCEWLELT